MSFYKLKELIIVLAVAAAIFYFSKPIVLRFISEEDFARRRLVWFVLTVTAFFSPSFWIYVLVAAPMLIWSGRKDSNAIALYLLLLHVIPPIPVNIPILGNNGLFALDNYRLLAICVLIPAIRRFRAEQKGSTRALIGKMDVLLLTFGVLQVALYTPPDLPHHFIIPDSPTNALRRAVLFILDTYLLFIAVSWLCSSKQKIIDAIASFCLACTIIAALAVFENAKGWLLYLEIVSRWGTEARAAFYLSREGSVRAQVSTGHALALGYLVALATGFWLYLKTQARSQAQRVVTTIVLWGGLIAAYSRGPWAGALAIYFAFNAASPRGATRVIKGFGVAIIVGAIIAVTPIGDRILQVLPVMGNTTDFNVLYRQRLATRGWEIVRAHPLFGDQFPWPEMEDLRQGEGIIDIVNSYLGVALEYGFVGLFCFLGFIVLAMLRTYKRTRDFAKADPDLALLGASLIACIIGSLIMIDSSSFNNGIEKMFYVLAGLATAYARLGSTARAQSRAAPKEIIQEQPAYN